MKLFRQLLFAVALAAVIGFLTYTAVTRYVVHKAEENLQSIILSHRSLHAYIQQVMHPTYFKAKDEGKVAQDFYAPQLLSSSYMIRVMHSLFNQERAKEGLPAVYYKMASQNPRNPVNIADEREAYFIKLFNERRDLKDHTEIQIIDGKKYLLYAKPFLETGQACIRCHGKRSDAPTGLQQIYSGQGGFNESKGVIRAIESIRIPLDDEFSAAFVVTTASLTAVVILIGLYIFNLRLRQRVKESTAALANSEKRYRHFTSITSDYVHMCTRKGNAPYRIQWIGGALNSISGYNIEEMHERGCWLSIVHPDDKDATAETLESLRPDEVRDISFRIIAKDQGVRWITDTCLCERGATDDELILYGAATDITERKKAEESLLLTRTSVNVASDAIFWITQDARFVDVNAASCNALGYSREELLMLGVSDVDPGHSLEVWVQHFTELRRLGTLRFESAHRTKDGRIFPVEVVANYVRHDNDEFNCAIVRDISERKQMEEALRKSDQFNQQIIRSAHEGIIVYGTDLRYQVWNPFMEQLSGVAARDVLGRHPLEVFPFLKDVSIIERLERILKEGVAEEVEFPYSISGKEGWTIDTSSPLHAETGEVIGIIATVQDITERKLAVEALLQSEEKFRSIVESSPMAMYFYRLYPDGDLILTGANPSAEKIIGISHHTLISKRIEDAFPDLKNTNVPEMYRNVARGVLGPQSFEITYNDGQFNGAFDVYVYQTGPETISVNFLEISNRKRAEEELQLTSQRLRLATTSGKLGVWDWNLVDSTMTWDDRMLELYGMTRETFPGGIEVWERGLHPDDRNATWELCQAALRGEKEWNTDYRVLHPDGTVLHIHANGIVIRDDNGTAARMIGINYDITERKRAEDLIQQKSAEMEQFIYTVSHDLRSPLVTVKTFLGYLEQDMAADSDRVSKDLEFIYSAADRMEALLNELLNISRIGKTENPHEDVSFRELTGEALDSLAGQISTRKVDVRVIDLDLHLSGDRRRLLQVWQNLLENSLKYFGDQPAPLIELGAEEQQGETVFFVRDNGIGIAPAYHEKIFNIFEQLDRQSGGVGMGLTMVRRIVELYGGRIWVESEGEGYGSCFRFTLPGVTIQENN